MDITTKKGRRGRKDIDRIIVEKGRRGDFSPLQPDHYHSFYEIFYLWSGSCRFLLKDTVYQMEAGDLVFIAPGELHHSLYSAGEVCEIVMIYFKEEYLHLSDRSADSLTSISGQGLQLHSFMGSVPTVYQEYLHSLLTRMLTENSRFDQYSEHFERCYLEELLLMRKEYHTAMILVTHNIGVAAYMADKMIVMKQGKVVDSGDREEILHNPKSDYTKNLLLAVPSLKGERYV